MRGFEDAVWAKFATPINEEEEAQVQASSSSRVNSTGSPLRRIIQRQSSEIPGLEQRDWKQAGEAWNCTM